MLAPHRRTVIDNIRQAVSQHNFHAKVEVDDPILTADERTALLRRFVERRHTVGFTAKRLVARIIANSLTRMVKGDTTIIGLDKIAHIQTGAIVTSNHFNPFDNAFVRLMALASGKRCLPIVSQDTNFAMRGLIGFLMRYADLIPISDSREYMAHHFGDMIAERLHRCDYVLMYAEQEMWFNYRKPRPLKKGAYYYAALYGVPVIPCFVEIRPTERMQTADFHHVHCTLHILDPIYPDPTKSPATNAVEMCAADYARKQQAYELAYARPLDYTFSPWDIAGWEENAH